MIELVEKSLEDEPQSKPESEPQSEPEPIAKSSVRVVAKRHS